MANFIHQMKLDNKNCQILNLLQQNCRMSLTKISKEVGLSVDSTKKRIQKMIADRVFYPKIQLRPRNFGFNNVSDIKIKLHNHTNEDITEFIDYLKEYPNIVEVFSVSGEWDFSLVILSKTIEELGTMSGGIRHKFSKIINTWTESTTTYAYKFENYDMLKLMGHE